MKQTIIYAFIPQDERKASDCERTVCMFFSVFTFCADIALVAAFKAFGRLTEPRKSVFAPL